MSEQKTNPHEKLHHFLDLMNIEPEEQQIFEEIAPFFLAKKESFAAYLYNYFLTIKDTRGFLENESPPGHMAHVWAQWFSNFFISKITDDFLTYLWGIGVKHVEINLDQRFSSLGFAMVRQFCHKIVISELPVERQSAALHAISKKLDLCLLAETTAYIEHTISCDIEIIQEVADRVRNPATIIGLNIRKLQNKAEKGSKEYGLFNMLMAENQRLESMVRDIKIYMDVFEGQPKFTTISANTVITHVVEKLHIKEDYPHVEVKITLGPQAPIIEGDQDWLEHLLYYLLENSLEAIGHNTGFIDISAKTDEKPSHYVHLEIINSGAPPVEDPEKLFTPFFSTKVVGTGFGLPIARLIAQKHHGMLSIGPEAGKGTKATVMLPGH
jgi:signal transduction histidine kinase